MVFSRDPRASFTLIELLIVIAVVAILSVVVILTLNPGELLKQARDSNRISDMDTLNRAMLLYIGDRGGSLGTASTTYLSLVDPTATSSAGTNCAGLGLIAPTNWNYRCAASSTQRKIDGTGWIPLNFSQMTFNPPMGSLPVDPTNASSSSLFYTYIPGTTTYALAAGLESAKFLGSKGTGDDGLDPIRIETGSNLSLIAQGEGLMGWWKLDEVTGTAAADASGNNRNGTYTGSTTLNQSPLGSLSGRAVDFVSQSGSVNLGVNSVFSPTAGGWTISAWVRPLRQFINGTNYEIFGNEFYENYGILFRLESNHATTPTAGRLHARTNRAAASSQMNSSFVSTINLNLTAHVVWTFDGTNGRLYVNGELIGGPTALSYPVNSSAVSAIGSANSGQQFNGLIDDVRFYSRPLTAAEIATMYNLQK